MRTHRFILPAIVAGALVLAPAAFADLNPPPPSDYSCNATGGGTICRVQRVNVEAPTPVEPFCNGFDIFDQGVQHRDLTRRYDANGNWVERVSRDRWLDSYWSNPANGDTVPYTQRSITTDVLGVPGDPNTITETQTGENQYTDPVTHKQVLHSVGRQVTAPDGSSEAYSGQQPFLDYFAGVDPTAFAHLCTALAR